MSADRQVDTDCQPGGGLPEALYFPSGQQLLFGWLHLPIDKEPPGDLGLVICKPFGYESICSHRSVRIFAESAAASGVPALRFDYSGTGDSAEIEPTANQLDIWTCDVIAAVEELQRRTGVERVCLLGFRIGAMLAAIAADRRKSIGGLILVAPVVSGRRYLRELRTTSMAAAALGPQTREPRTTAQGDAGAARSDALETGGFSMSAASVEALRSVDLVNLPSAPAPEVLIIDSSALPTAAEFSAALGKLGARTTYLTMSGIVEMLMTAPGFGATSQPMVEAVGRWLAGLRESLPRSGALARVSAPSAAAMTLTLLGDSPAKSSLIAERPVFFSSDTLLFGIVTEPPAEETRRRGVILLNAGADHHIGASRIYVSLARRWAQNGYFVLRMDFAGMGDSGVRAGHPVDDVFPHGALDDIRAAIDFLKSRYGVGDITVAGLCSGAYHALRAAAAGLPINRILMVNPQNFFWKKGMTVSDLQLAEVVRNPGLYSRQVLSIKAWQRLLTGKVQVWRIVKIIVQRPLLTLKSLLRDIARRLRIRLPRDLGRELQEIAARGVRMVFVFAHGEPGIDLLRIEGGSSLARLGERCRVRIVDSGDHVFSGSGPRAELEKVLTEELFVRAVLIGPSNESVVL